MNGDEKQPLYLTDADVEILKFLQEDIPLTAHPYAMLAENLRLTEAAVADRIRTLQAMGAVRRVGVLLNHERAGFKVNALTAWNAEAKRGETPAEALDRVGKALAEFPFVSHCYIRETPPGWDWPIFAMVHAVSDDELQSFIRQMEQAAGTLDHRVLKTRREWKKTSMRYL